MDTRRFVAYFFVALALVAGSAFLQEMSVLAETASSTSTGTEGNGTSTPPEPTPEELQRRELENRIQARNRELDDLNRRLAETKASLDTTKKDKSKLQKELATLQNNIAQLTLNIKADELSVEKLGLEIQALSYDLNDIRASIATKQDQISAVLKAIQKSDKTSLLATFLKNETLAAGVTEAATLRDFQEKLSTDVAGLRDLQSKYSDKLQQTSDKKTAINLHQLNLKNRKLIVEDQKQSRQVVLVQTKNKESLYEKQISELEKQQQKIAEEIEEIDRALRGQINTGELPLARKGVLGPPVAKLVLTQGYGTSNFARSAYRGGRHNGLDFQAAVGTPVLATEDGTVAAVGNQDAYCPRGAYGKFIVVNHDNNLTTLYAHLSRQIVSAGERIKRGQVIGYSGSTGYATGPHLHLTVFARSTFYMGSSRVCGPMPYGGDLDPGKYL